MKTGTFLNRVCSVFSIIPGFLNAYLLFGKEQYTCWGGRTAVQANLYTCTSQLVKVTA